MRSIWMTTLFPLLLLAGCAARIALTPLPAGVPGGLDISGQWTLASSSVAVNEIRGKGAVTFSSKTSEPVLRDVPGSAVFVFLETGRELKITQTDAGLFVSFDRAIVEEYRFGELRRISVGPIEAQRATGFPDGILTIQTADEDGAVMTETYQRQGQQLLRAIRIVRGNKVLYSEQRRYRERDTDS